MYLMNMIMILTIRVALRSVITMHRDMELRRDNVLPSVHYDSTSSQAIRATRNFTNTAT